MRCRYCKQKLNIFKSLAGSSFCSPEHQKLYEEAEANKGIERLLQFVEKDGKPLPPAKAAPASALAPPPPPPPAAEPLPPPVPEVRTIAVSEPPSAGFLLSPIASPLKNTAGVDLFFEIPEASFPPDPPALPSTKFALDAASLDSLAEEPPPPLASWSNLEPAVMETLAGLEAVPSAGPVRPRAIEPTLLSPQGRAALTTAPAAVLISNTRSLQVSMQAVIDTRGFADLARSLPLPREVPLSRDSAQFSPRSRNEAAFAHPGAVPRRSMPPRDKQAGVAIGLSAPMTRSGVARAVSLPATNGPAAPAFIGLPRSPLANLTFSQRESPAVGMNGAMRRAGAARPIRQPQVLSSRSESVFGSCRVLNQVLADLQNWTRLPETAALPARSVELGYITTPLESNVRECAGIPSGMALRTLAIRESDMVVTGGITDVNKPSVASSPLSIPAVAADMRRVALAAGTTTRMISARVQTNVRSESCAIAPVRTVLRETLLPAAAILRSGHSRLRSASAFGGWFRERDSVALAFPGAAPAARLFPVRYTPESFAPEAPSIASDSAVRRLLQEFAEWTAEAQRLARPQASRTSPLSLVVRPKPRVTALALRQVAKNSRFTAIPNSLHPGIPVPAITSASMGEHASRVELPQFSAGGPTFTFRFGPQTASKPSHVEPIESKNAPYGTRPQPSPLRAQPASMLLMPAFCEPIHDTRCAATVGWATVASANAPKNGHIQVLPSEQTNVDSLRSLASAVRLDRAESPALGRNGKPRVMSLDTGAQMLYEVPAANALPRRRGPNLPIVPTPLGDLGVTSR